MTESQPIPIKNSNLPLPTLESNLISRYELRLKALWQNPSPYIKPLWEKSEIEQKVKELKKTK